MWDSIFDLQLSVGEKVLRAVLIYIFLVVALRVVGKRELGQVLIEKGKPVPKALRRESISLPELRAIARRQGFADLGEVDSAILETNGVVTMFREDEPGLYHPAEAGGLRIGKRRRAH